MKIEIVAERSGIYGGLKRLYVLAQYFIEAGHQTVINIADGSTNNWFTHQVPENQPIEPDLRIIPETWQKPHPKAKNLLYVQAQFDEPLEAYDGIVTTSTFLQEITKENGFDSQIIPYGFDSNLFIPRPEKRIIRFRDGHIPNTVAFMPRKNVQEARIVQQLCPEVNFISIDGIKEIEVIDLLQKSDIFLALSRVEGFGCPPFEAILSGCLVIGYHGQGGRDYLTPDIYVPISSPSEMAMEVKKAITGIYEKRRKAGREKISRELTLKREAESWQKLISNI